MARVTPYLAQADRPTGPSRACASPAALAERRDRRSRSLGLAALALLAGCAKAPGPEGETSRAATSASAVVPPPQPLTEPAPPPRQDAAPPRVGIPADSAGRLVVATDAGAPPPPPQAPATDQPLDPDPTTARELAGVTLEGEWRLADLPSPPRAPEVNLAGLDAARKLAAPRLTIDLASVGRMRVAFTGRSLPVAEGAELRSRLDRYGHVLVWPNGEAYRLLPPGAARTLLAERRADAVPLLRPDLGAPSEGAHRLGLATRKLEISTRAGKVTIEAARVAEAGEGATLFCRFLAEIVAVDPQVAPCSPEMVPLRAVFAWAGGGTIAFEVTNVARRTNLPTGLLLAPPPAAAWQPGGLPPGTTGIFLTRDELAATRTRALDLGPSVSAGAPGEGIVAVNPTDLLRYLVLDGVPVAWVAPGGEQYLIGPPRGRYVVQGRTFLGESIDPPRVVELPARVTLGGRVDAGAPLAPR